MRKIDTEDIGLNNENLVYRTLMRRQPISRVGLSKVTRLSFPTVTKITKEFQEKELILEDSIGESSGGRKPTLLRINPQGGYVVGIHLEVLETSIALLDLEGHIKKMVKIPTDIESRS